MHIEPNTDPNTADVTDVWVKHRGRAIGWKMPTLFKRSANRDGVDFDLYVEINIFMSRLEEDKQDQLFEMYQKFRQALTGSQRVFGDARRLFWRLHKEFYDILVYEDALHWVKYYADIPIPASITEEYVQDDGKPYTQMMTYVHEDYRKLQALIVLGRAILPVWGEILVKEAKQIESDWKEMHLFRLLSESSLFKCEPMEKLRFYATNQYQVVLAKNPLTNDSALFSGMSSADIPVYLLGFCMVRKIIVGHMGTIPGNNSSLISSVYNIIEGRLKNNSQNWSGLVRVKDNYDTDGNDDDNKMSVHERNRKRPALADGEITMIEVIASDIAMARRSKFPWLPMTTLRESQRAVKEQAANVEIHDVQIALAEVALQDWLEVGHLGMFDPPLLMANLALAQAVAWHRGHYMIAALITANATPPTTFNTGRLSQQDHTALNEIFPYHRRSISKQRRELQKTTNPAVRTIDLAFKDISNFDWYTTIPDTWLQSSPAPVFVDRLVTTVDLRRHLSDYAIAFQKGYQE